MTLTLPLAVYTDRVYVYTTCMHIPNTVLQFPERSLQQDFSFQQDTSADLDSLTLPGQKN